MKRTETGLKGEREEARPVRRTNFFTEVDWERVARVFTAR